MHRRAHACSHRCVRERRGRFTSVSHQPRDQLKSNLIHSWSHGLPASLIPGDEDDEDDDDLDGPTGKRAADEDDDDEEVRMIVRHTHQQESSQTGCARVQQRGRGKVWRC